MAKKRGLHFYTKKKKVNKSIVKEILIWVIGCGIAVFLAGVLNYFLGIKIGMVGISMEPTIGNEQQVFVDRFRYVLSTPHEGDVIAFLPNGNKNSHYYIKRVIAVPGDKIQTIEGIMYRNGIQSQYVKTTIEDGGISDTAIVLGAGEYFCVGDNPNNSEDSRSADIGIVKDSYILGKVWFALGSDENEEHTMGFVK